jgi:DNA-directed RNA polymerase subunit RPC12/RpoP
MSFNQCPGSDKLRHPYPEFIKCPDCGEEVEIWTDEVKAKCPKCKKTVSRPQGQNCLDWCKSARECVGEEIYNKYLRNKSK